MNWSETTDERGVLLYSSAALNFSFNHGSNDYPDPRSYVVHAMTSESVGPFAHSPRRTYLFIGIKPTLIVMGDACEQPEIIATGFLYIVRVQVLADYGKPS